MLTVITGPPCVGKSTYLTEHASPGDITVDFDVMAQALGSPVTHDHSEAMRQVTMVARRAAIDAAVKAHLAGATVWIVDSRPTQAMVRAYRRVGGRVVALRADPAELHRRADQAGRPERWHSLIDSWFASLPVASCEW